MNRNIAFKLLLLLLCCSSCTNGQSAKQETAMVAPSAILKDMDSWGAYRHKYLLLSRNFIAYDENHKPIDRGLFLKKVSEGKYLPLRVNAGTNSLVFRLFPFPQKTDLVLKSVIKEVGKLYFNYYTWEGKKFPDFSFKDLDGKTYSNKIVKGKIVVLKCWYISCIPCVQEMPELNNLVAEQKDRKDILFIGLAFDQAKALSAFLKKVKFVYHVVPNQKPFLLEKLKVFSYPTHIIIDKNGFVIKAVGDVGDLKSVLHDL
ncbi:Peroxiredoxin [Pedobacter steynii]|uniref:Peroxiredoxin n=1 Tax=Pedobacter steynii TaxID=430522 RepID=A0A1G9K8D4_9SPHI|nr:TlpA disulfide reductase family protein [Pedobacter steynii]NQX38471.1 TlpA family protein disulfide reductase [Pedobacter steynii]SDL45695.1 Peroxiredoxin [Pedobacter steynii]